LTTIVESDDPAPQGVFYAFGDLTIVDDTVAFQGYYQPSQQLTGIFTGGGGELTTVIKTGDPLFGSTIPEGNDSLSLGRFGLDPEGSGRIVFYYELTDGREGIAVATPIPEPTGDFNEDGVVDAADYVVWRKNNGSQQEYDTWRANFGTMPGTSSAFVTSVPEPRAWSLLSIAIVCSILLGWPRLRVERAQVLHGCRQTREREMSG
jgi:hypothetical protein